MVGDLQDIDVRHAGGQEIGVDLLLEIAGQEEASAGGLAEEHDGEVVDRLAVVERRLGNVGALRGQHPEVDVVETQAVAGAERPSRGRAVLERRRPGRVPRARAGQP
jgi:hypothetical protein